MLSTFFDTMPSATGRPRPWPSQFDFTLPLFSRSLGSKLLLATAAACSISSVAFADEVLKLKTFTHVVAAQSLDVGDADGHALSIARGVGLLLLPDGTAGTTTRVAENDYHKGSGPNPIVYLSFT